MVRSLLIRGMLAGLLAGGLGFFFARLIGEPPVEAAIAFESYVGSTAHHAGAEHAGAEEEDGELVSRPLQSSAGLGTGTLLFGVALGGIFALVFAAAYGRIGPLSARGTAALLGAPGSSLSRWCRSSSIQPTHQRLAIRKPSATGRWCTW